MTYVQEEFPRKPGFVENPFTPLLDPLEPIAPGVPKQLAQIAGEVDNMGNKADFAKNLNRISEDIRTKILSWYEIGLTAYKIKLYKAWDKKFFSFSEFCQNAIGRSAGTVNNWIRGSRVISNLIAGGFERLPASPAIALELAAFAVDDLYVAWSELCFRYKDHELTLDKVKDFLAMPNKKKEYHTSRIPIDLYDRMKETAAAAGLSVNQLLESMFPQSSTHEEETADEVTPLEASIDDDETVDESQNFIQRYRVKFAPPENDYYWDSLYSPQPEPVPF